MKDKLILDACCGSRMFWFDKENPNVLFQDIRDEEYILCDGRQLKIHPDVVGDFTKMQYEDNTFQMVVFDPPHIWITQTKHHTWLKSTEHCEG